LKNHALAAAVAAALFAAPFASAEFAVSANDHKQVMNNGAQSIPANAPSDTVSIIDLAAKPPKLVAEINVPASVIGPPVSVAITTDESLAFVTSAQKLDPADATKVVPDNRVSIIDLKASPPAVVGTVEAGAGASGVSVNAQGTLVLVANRNEGTVSVFKLAGKTLTPAGKLNMGDAKSGPSHVVFTPDGKRALLTRDGDHTISILAIDGDKVTDAKRDFGIGYRPYGVDITNDGKAAVVANVGRGLGDLDTVSLIDMQASPPRVVDTVSVGYTLEGIILSPDGRTAAIVAHNGSNKPKGTPFAYGDKGKLVLLRVDGGKLSRLTEAPIGTWSQGVAFSKDGRTILVQNMVEREIQLLSFDGTNLKDNGERIKVNGGPAAIRVASPRP
jgi:DNA-binding beta-propeller fold protein YncE